MYKVILFFFSFFTLICGNANNIKEKISLANELKYSNPDSAFNICCTLEENLEDKEHNINYAETQLCKGRYYILKSNLDKATQVLNNAITVFEKEKNLSRLAKCYSLKSIIFQRLNDTEKSMNHLTIAYNLYIEDNNIEGQITSLINISVEYLRINKNDSALNYLNQLTELNGKFRNTDKYYYHQNFGMYYHNTAQYRKALSEFKLALSVAERENMIDSKTTIYMEMAETYFAQKDYKSAENHLFKSIAIATSNNLMHETNESYLLLIKLYEIQGDYKSAYLAKVINDSIETEIYNIERINKINEIETELAFSENQKIIAQQELDIKNEQLNTLNAKSKISQLIFVVILCLVIIMFVIIIFIRARKLSAKINHQKILLEEKNNEITDSITYAKRIQAAILPSDEIFKTHLPNSFVLYKPKDIVAGDFYWMEKVNNEIFFAAADCTGHGVPGAMVSVVCSNALNHGLEKNTSINPGLLLDSTRDFVKNKFETDSNNVKDGMDIALCALNFSTNQLQFSGANNPLYIIRENELIEIKGDKQHIGKHHKESKFTNHNINLKKNDCIYLFSDGYADQFGGPKGKKFMYKQFKNLLLKISNLPLNQQKEILDDTFENWRGDLEQIDDVCVIGVKI